MMKSRGPRTACHDVRLRYMLSPVRLSSVGPIANLKGPYFQPSLSVCVSVCLSVSDRHFYLQCELILTKLGHKDPTVIYTVSQKNWATFIFTVTLSNVGRF